MSCNHGRHAMMLAILQSIASPEWKLDVHETSRLNVVGCVGRLALWIMRADWCNSGIASIEAARICLMRHGYRNGLVCITFLARDFPLSVHSHRSVTRFTALSCLVDFITRFLLASHFHRPTFRRPTFHHARFACIQPRVCLVPRTSETTPSHFLRRNRGGTARMSK